MNRGDRRESIFADGKDRELFLETLGQACEKTDWCVHALCLMSNHFHLVVETPHANLVAGMKWLLGTYTARYNRRHKEFGHLFSGRYKSLIVDGSGSGYLKTVCDYVHLNPARAKLLKPGQRLREYEWSTYRWYLEPTHKRPAWLRVDRLLGEHGIPRDSKAGRREFESRMEERMRSEDERQYKPLRRGWYLGGVAFRKELLGQMAQKAGAHHYGEEVRQCAEEKARRLVDEELRRRRWKEENLKRSRKGDPVKVQIARRLRGETTMTLEWIAHRLNMGTKTHLAHLLYWRK